MLIMKCWGCIVINQTRKAKSIIFSGPEGLSLTPEGLSLGPEGQLIIEILYETIQVHHGRHGLQLMPTQHWGCIVIKQTRKEKIKDFFKSRRTSLGPERITHDINAF